MWTHLRAVETSAGTLDLSEPLSETHSVVSVLNLQQSSQGIACRLHTRGGAFAAGSAVTLVSVGVFLVVVVIGAFIAEETCTLV